MSGRPEWGAIMGNAPPAAWYYREPMRPSGTAKVILADGPRVVLDRTLLFPGGGGQPADTGTIGGHPVRSVAWDGDRIVHEVPGHAFHAGDDAEVAVDWPRRVELMRGHTAEHLLTGCFRARTRFEIQKVQIGEALKRIYARSDATWGVVREAVADANRRIAAGAPVTDRWIPGAEVRAQGIRANWERLADGDVRVLSIGDFDHAACAGVHVPDIAQLGAVSVTRLGAGEGLTEVDFLVGAAAVAQAAVRAVDAAEAAHVLGAPPELLVKTAGNIRGELGSLRADVADLSDRVLAAFAPAVLRPGEPGIRLYEAVLPHAAPVALVRYAAGRIRSAGTVALCGGGGSQPFLLLACSADVDLDCPALLREGLALVEGKGGGTARFAQGGGKRPELLVDSIAKVRAAVERFLHP